MRKLLFLSLVALFACQPADQETGSSNDSGAVESSINLNSTSPDAGAFDGSYPPSRQVDHVDNYHGTDVADPYRWLENDVRESSEVAAWVEAQNKVTFAYLETIPERNLIRQRLTELWDYEKFGVPFSEGGKYFYFRNDGLQNQSVLFMQDTLESEPQVIVDPNSWSADGTVALADVEISPDGRYASLAVQDGGSDWRTVRVLDIEAGEELEHELEWVKFSPMVWKPDSSGFYYSRFPATEEGDEFQSLNRNQRIYFHRIGDTQENDRLVYSRDDQADWLLLPGISDDGRFLIISAMVSSSGNQIAFIDLSDPENEPVFLTDDFDHEFSFVGNRGNRLFFQTDKDAPRGRLISVDSKNPDEENWQVLVPESDSVIRQASLVGGNFLVTYLKDAFSQVVQFNENGEELRTVALPGIGSVTGFAGKFDSSETFYSYSSFNSPPGIYRYDIATGQSDVFKTAHVDFDPADYVVKQVFYESRDGTRIPMFIAHRSDLELTGDTPTLLYGYGGFNVALSPSFSVTRLAWMEMGGVFALANIRGGGEYGEEWHKAGTKLQKQNVFDDFIAAAEYLIANQYTRPEKLSVLGGSNGGLLVGAVVNQRPDLFGAALAAVGVMDMLRFHQFTAGRFWTSDYGSADDPEEFKALLAYSPYHNLKEDTHYPAILVTTADTDDRVVPGHSFKYAARLQASQGGTAPVLIRIETRAGHGSGKPTSKRIEEYADTWSFLVENLDLSLPEGYGMKD